MKTYRLAVLGKCRHQRADNRVNRAFRRRHALLHSDPMMDWSRARFEVFRKALGDAGLWCEEIFDPSAAAKLYFRTCQWVDRKKMSHFHGDHAKK